MTNSESENPDTEPKNTEEKEKRGFFWKLDDFCEKGHLSGFKFLHSSYPIWFRLVWVVFMILFICMMLYQLVTLFTKLAEEPVTTDVKEEYPSEIRMPNVLLCPHHQMRLTKLSQNDYLNLALIIGMPNKNSSAEMEQLRNVSSQIITIGSEYRLLNETAARSNCTIEQLKSEIRVFLKKILTLWGKSQNLLELPKYLKNIKDSLEAVLEEIEKRNVTDFCKGIPIIVNSDVDHLNKMGSLFTKDFGEILKSASSSKDEYVIRCSYKDSPDTIDCKPLLTEVPTVFGQCYLLNMSQHSITRSGIDYAIQMEFDSAKFDAASNGDNGLMISLLNDGDILYPVDPVELNVGYNVHMPLRFSHDFFDSSVCRTEDLKKLKLPYSRSGCMLERFLETVEEECKCKPYGEPSLKTDVKRCTLDQQFSCVFNLAKNAKLLWDGTCPVARGQSQYKPTLSYSVVDYSKWDKAPPEWRTMSNNGVKELFKLTKKIPKEDWKKIVAFKNITPEFNQTVLKVLLPLYQYFSYVINPLLYYHGVEFAAYPIQFQGTNKTSISELNRLGKCPLKDLQLPYPEFLKENSTLYVGLNSIATLANLDGSTNYAVQVLKDDLFTVLRFVLATIKIWKSHESPKKRVFTVNKNVEDTLADQLLVRGEEVERCLEENNCSSVVCILNEGECYNETETYAFAVREILLIRDYSFLMRQYLEQIEAQNREFSTFNEAIGKHFYYNYFSHSASLIADYWKMSALDASEWLLNNFDTWKLYVGKRKYLMKELSQMFESIKKYYEDQRERTDQIVQYLDFVKQTSNSAENKGVILRANLTLPQEMLVFNRFFNCALIYEKVWKLAKNDSAISKEWIKNATIVLDEAKEHLAFSKAEESYYKKNVMSATIYLSEMRVEHRTQSSAYDFWEMLADIGGTISLYVGGTIITFFEILFICTELDRKKKLVKRNKNKMKQQVQMINAVAAFKMSQTLNPGTPWRAVTLDLNDIEGPETPKPAAAEPLKPKIDKASLLKALRETAKQRGLAEKTTTEKQDNNSTAATTDKLEDQKIGED